MRERLLYNLSNKDKKVIYMDGKSEYLYSELYHNVLLLNRFFVAHNVKRVAIYMDKSFSSYSLILAAYLSKVTFSVWNTELPKNRIEYFYSIYKPDFVFIDNEQFDFLNNAIVFNLINFDTASEQDNAIIEVQDNELAYVLFTSGSTSMPKGCKISYQSLDLLIEKAISEFDIRETDVYGQYAPFYFDMSVLDIFVVPYVGASLVAFSTFNDKLRPGTIIQNRKITFINSVPQMYDILERGKQFLSEMLASVRQIKIGGDIVKKSLLDRIFSTLPNVNVYITYGPTETTVICMIVKLNRNNYKELCDGYIASLGKAIDGYSNISLTSDGEILISGPCVGLGYLSGDNDNFIISDTGQVSYLSGDYAKEINGYLFFNGRKDEQAKINGNRINVMEIEAAIAKHLIESVALIISNRIILFYVSNAYNEKEIHHILETEIPTYELPSLIIRLDKFQYNPNGKVDKQFLKMHYNKILGE